MVATRTNALWQRCKIIIKQPVCFVATRTNALWQRVAVLQPLLPFERRNPHECAVAKLAVNISIYDVIVATRTNALWQSLL